MCKFDVIERDITDVFGQQPFGIPARQGVVTRGPISPDIKITIGALSDTHLHGVTEALKEICDWMIIFMVRSY